MKGWHRARDGDGGDFPRRSMIFLVINITDQDDVDENIAPQCLVSPNSQSYSMINPSVRASAKNSWRYLRFLLNNHSNNFPPQKNKFH